MAINHTFSHGMVALIERRTGMSIEQIRSKSIDEIHSAIENRIGHKLKLGFEPGRRPRGNVLLDMDRVIWPNEST